VKTYIHSIPGRLRLRDDQLRVDPVATDALQAELRTLPGILDVDFHPTSSSLLVRYDTGTLAPEEMLFTLRAHGYLHGEFTTNLKAKQTMRGKLGTLLVRNVKEAAVSSVAGYVLEAAVIRYVPAAALPLLLLSLARRRGPF